MKNLSPTRRLRDLIDGEHCVYLYLASEAAEKDFQRRAESERIRFADGVSAAERQPRPIMRLQDDGTLCYVGFAGAMRFRHDSDPGVLCVDYEKYIRGDDDYLIQHPAAKDNLPL